MCRDLNISHGLACSRLRALDTCSSLPVLPGHVVFIKQESGSMYTLDQARNGSRKWVGSLFVIIVVSPTLLHVMDVFSLSRWYPCQ